MSTAGNTVIYTAPAGWGKTLAAEDLRKLYDCDQVIDEWDPHTAVTAGALHLTNTPPEELRKLFATSRPWLQRTIVSRGWHQHPKQQAGRALLEVLVATTLFVLVLGAFGPALDGDLYGTPAPTRDLRDEFAALEAHAAEQCRQAGGENAGWVRTGTRGEIACTDKHGRKHRHVITVLHRSEQ